MSGIYIPMEMPKDNSEVLIIAVESNGTVFPVRIDGDGNPMIFENEEMKHIAIPVPDHGRLIDADALREEVKKHATPSDAWVFSFIRTAPTIIGADKEGE